MRRKKRPPETPYTMAEVMEMETESTMTHYCLMMILMIPEMRGVTVLGIWPKMFSFENGPFGEYQICSGLKMD